jgi:hypothetical protein
MTDNVIILGAGASVDAGIPLLANFVEKMWEFAITGKHNGKDLSEEDIKIFNEAMKVKNELDGYHGRAAFNDRNIEDILSILSFNLIGGKKSDHEKQRWFIKAITRTIDLTCNVQHNGTLNKMQTEGKDLYRSFWRGLFNRFQNSPNSFPTIITFNYDLVLERSLFQSLIGTNYNQYKSRFPFAGLNLKYHYGLIKDLAFAVKYVRFTTSLRDFGEEDGMKLEAADNPVQNSVNVELLKLHGSLNFPTHKDEDFSPTQVSNDPYILPPIINKWVGKNEESIWSTGLQRLREAKNIIIIGYSLPQTDIFMQYFLRAGVGPNLNLNKVIVFNPALYRNNTENELMRERFGNCFSPQLRSRINFNPVDFSKPALNGSFEGFVERLDNADWFFGHYEQSEKSFIGF